MKKYYYENWYKLPIKQQKLTEKELHAYYIKDDIVMCIMPLPGEEQEFFKSFLDKCYNLQSHCRWGKL